MHDGKSESCSAPNETSRRKAAPTGGDRCGKGDAIGGCAAARVGETPGGVDAEQGRHRVMKQLTLLPYVCTLRL
jgi:hypothetical protein